MNVHLPKNWFYCKLSGPSACSRLMIFTQKTGRKRVGCSSTQGWSHRLQIWTLPREIGSIPTTISRVPVDPCLNFHNFEPVPSWSRSLAQPPCDTIFAAWLSIILSWMINPHQTWYQQHLAVGFNPRWRFHRPRHRRNIKYLRKHQATLVVPLYQIKCIGWIH
jgi:hypothetical protein